MKKLFIATVAIITLLAWTSVFADTFTKTNGEYSKEMTTKRIISYLKRRKTCPKVSVKTTDGQTITGTCEEVITKLTK